MRRKVKTPGTGAATRRQAVALGACVLLAVLTTAAPSHAAQPSPEPGESPPAPDSELEVPDPVPGEPVCEIVDPRLHSISGVVATDDGYIVINDSQLDDSLRPIFFLDSTCAVVDEQSFFPGQPRDPEDMEFDPDNNVLWIGDIGDNQAAGTNDGQPRDWITLWRVDLSGGDRTPVVHRLAYPDGQARDAEALLLTADGTPLIVTKTIGAAELFLASDLQPDNPPEAAALLEAVGEFDPPDTGSDNRFGAAGRRVVTGGAVAPDGSRLVLRTYADAFEFDVPDGDVITAITEGEPRVTPLPDEPQGEAITYTPDGSEFLTVSENPDDVADFVPVVLRYTPTEPVAEPTAAAEEPVESESGGGGFSLVNSVQDIINLVAAVGVLGLLLVTAGVIGIVRARRRAAGAGSPTGDDDDDDPDDAQGAPVRGRARLMGDDPEQGWEPDQRGRPASAQASVPEAAAAQTAAPAANAQAAAPAAQAAGVYTSRAAVPAATAPQEAPAPGTAAGTEYGARRAGTTYGGGEQGPAEYPAREYDGREHRGAEYGAERGHGRDYGRRPASGQEYGAPAYSDRGEDTGYGPANERGPANEHGGAYRGNAYRAREYPGDEYQAEGYPAGNYQTPEYSGAGYPASPYRGGEYGGDNRGGGYPANEYQGAEGYPATDYRGADYAPNDYRGRGRSGGDDYRGEYRDEEYAAGHGGAGYAAVPDPRTGGTYGAAGYPEAAPGWPGTEADRGGYPDDGYDGYGRYEGYGADYPEQQPGGARGHSAHAAQSGSDYYSDDPDYPYEFRQPGRY